MPSRTFHPFPKLPIELRLKIWKTSCFPFADHEHGLHYIDLASLRDSKLPVVEYGKGELMKMTALHPDFKTSPEIQESIGHANRSAYMWGVGLWKACKESRDVIATHFQLKIWRGTQDKGLGPLDVDESLRAPRPHVPCPTGQHIIFRHSFNLALEFDSSWNDELPRTWRELKIVDSPRGLLTCWVETCMRGCGNAPWVYLFNKNAHCGPGWHVNEGAVFHDCDHTYMTVYLDPHPDKEYPDSPKETSVMLDFVHHLGGFSMFLFLVIRTSQRYGCSTASYQITISRFSFVAASDLLRIREWIRFMAGGVITIERFMEYRNLRMSESWEACGRNVKDFES